MSAIGAGVSLRNIYMEDWAITFNLASGIVAADEGKAVALDTGANNTMKIAGDGDEIMGRLEKVENRSVEGLLVGTVMLKGALHFSKGAGETVDVGDSIQGDGTSGAVKALTAASAVHTTHDRKNVVVESGTGYVIAILF